MTTGKGDCEHRCRNTCTTLSDALKDERKRVALFETMLNDCDDPAMKNFVQELIESHKLLANRISERLNEIKENARVLDDIIEGFES